MAIRLSGGRFTRCLHQMTAVGSDDTALLCLHML